MNAPEALILIATATAFLDYIKDYKAHKLRITGSPYRVRWLLLLCLAALLAGVLDEQTWIVEWDSAANRLAGKITNGRLSRLYSRGEKLPSVQPAAEGAYSWIGNESFLPIAHALGPQLFAGPNQIKTLTEGRKRGFRIFEIDLAVSADDHLVCFHGGSEAELDRMTYADYLQITRKQHLEPWEFRDLVRIVSDNPEIRIVLDVKNRFDRAYQIARREIASPALGKSFIPQIYHFGQLKSFRDDHFFAGEIFTSYQSDLTSEEMIDSARRLDIQAITLTRQRISELKAIPKDVWIFTHPVDDAFDAAQLRAAGVHGIYTSYLTRATIPELFEPWRGGCSPPQTWTNCSFTSIR